MFVYGDQQDLTYGDLEKMVLEDMFGNPLMIPYENMRALTEKFWSDRLPEADTSALDVL